MTVWKQKEIIHTEYTVKLESGVILLVFDGYAIGSDGKKYYHVGKDVDGVLYTEGWSSEINQPIII